MDKNAKMCYAIFMKRGAYMRIHDGKVRDITDFAANKYLQINSCGFQNIEENYTVIRKDGRKDYHILMISGGKCEVFHNGSTYLLTSGNIVIYAPGEEQMYSFKTDSSTMWCHFSGTIIDELMSDCDLSSGIYFFENNKNILDSFSNLIHRFHIPGMEKSSNALLLELIYAIYETKNMSLKNTPDLLLPVLSYMNINYNKQITVDELAKLSGYSKSRFSHRFSELVGTTPIKYLNDIRLKISCQMLISTDMSVTDISISCGFYDSLYFSRVFRKKYGISPSEYRKTNMKN